MKKINIKQKKISRFFSFLIKGFVGVSLLVGIYSNADADVSSFGKILEHVITTITDDKTNTTDCGVGKYLNRKKSCASCLKGKYQPSSNNSEGYNSCISAGIGYYVPFDGAPSQTLCPTGTYQDEEGQSYCKVAMKGKYVEDNTLKSCTLPDNAEFTEVTLIRSTYEKNVFKRFKKVKNNIDYGLYSKAREDIENNIIGNSSDSCAFVCKSGYSPSGNSCIKKQEKCDSGKYWDASSFDCKKASKGYFVGNYIGGEFNSTGYETSQTACPDGFYQDEEGQSFCKQIDFSNFGKRIMQDKTGIKDCTGKPDNGFFTEGFDNNGNCNIACNEGYTGSTCSTCSEGYNDSKGNGVCVSDPSMVKDNITKFQDEFKNKLSSTDVNIDEKFPFEDFTSSGNLIKNEIKEFFSNEDFKDFNVLNSEDGSYEGTYTGKIVHLLNEYNSEILSFSGSVGKYNDLVSKKSEIIGNFNDFSGDSGSDNSIFDFNKNTSDLTNIISEIGVNDSDNPTGVFGEIAKSKNNLINKKVEIEEFYENFLTKKEEFLSELENSFDDKKSSYLENFGDLETFSNKTSDFLNNKEIVISYFSGSTISIPDFNKDDFYSEINSYSGIILDLNDLNTEILNGKKSLLGINFNLDSNPKVNEDYLDSQLSNLDEKINQYNSKINNLSILESQIDYDFAIFEKYKIDNPKAEVLDIEYINKQKASVISENNRFALNVYNDNINNFNFKNNGVLKTQITLNDSGLSNIINNLNFSEIKDFDNLGDDYTKANRIKSIKNLIVSLFEDKRSTMNVGLVKSMNNIDKSIDLGNLKVEDLNLSDKTIRTEEESKQKINDAIVDTTKNLSENINSQNDLVVNYVKTVSGENEEQKIKDSEGKISILKKQLVYIKQQESNMLNLGHIEGCKPNEIVLGDDGIKYAGPEGLISCSKSDFKNNIDEQKGKIFDGLFSLISMYSEKFNSYKNNLISSAYVDGNVLVNGDGNSICKAGSVDLGNGCSELGKIKTKGVAYGSDAGAIIMDPFNCYNAANPEACMKEKDGLRLVAEDGKIKLKGIVYSSEVGAIKFGLGIDDIDAGFTTIDSFYDYSASGSVAVNSENERISEEIYNEILNKNNISFYDENGFFGTGTISDNLDSIFTNDYSDFSDLNLVGNEDGSRILVIKNLIKEKFYSKLNSLISQSEKIDSEYFNQDSNSISLKVSTLDLNSLLSYDLEIFNRIKSLGLVSSYVDDNLNLTFPSDNNKFLRDLKVTYSDLGLRSYISNNYSSIKSNLNDYLVDVRKKELNILNSISSGDLISNISVSNSGALTYTSTGSIKGNNIENRIFEIKGKIDFLKKQLAYLKDQELNMISYSIIPGCEPGKSKIINGIEYNNEGKLPCSKRLFQSELEKGKETVLDGLFNLVKIYKTEINNYISNSNNNLPTKGNMIIDGNGDVECKGGTIKLGEGCVDLSNIKIKGIAYGADSGPLILDPFGCSDKANKDLINQCKADNDGLRLEVENGSVKLKGIIYSPEVGSVKFGGIGVDLDAGFGTVQ